MTRRHGRPLILKSPPHMACIRLLLELFPGARFVHVRRDPFEVFRSTRHMYQQRVLIPAGHLCEVAYEDLERDPLGQVGAVYDALSLSGFDAVRPRLEGYLGSIAGYRKSQHPELPEPTRRRISPAWGRCVEEWGYS